MNGRLDGGDRMAPRLLVDISVVGLMFVEGAIGKVFIPITDVWDDSSASIVGE